MTITVEVKSVCKFTGLDYTNVEITEDELRDIAEKRVADSFMDGSCVTVTAQGIRCFNNA